MSFDVSTGEKVDLPALYGMTEAEMTALPKDFDYYFLDGELILTFPAYSLSDGATGCFTVPTRLYY